MDYRLLVVGSTLVALGCHGPRTGIEQAPQTVVIPAQAETDEMWSATMDLLRESRFRIDRVDRRAGVLTTFPETSQQFFEFWRHDVASWNDVVEANLVATRRWVEVRFDRESGPGEVNISVHVYKEKFSAPDEQINNSFAAPLLFSDRLPSTGGAPRITLADCIWIDAGRDPAMEQLLLSEIDQRIGISDAETTPPAEQTKETAMMLDSAQPEPALISNDPG